ncbi:hypothetical protein [Alteribacter keqinensis]|uniref:Uncharacterized protein n=1 Tax=Alteribacter keqinensis TaxID=2483800 RepID=A0A3M7TQ79_9BACI|nr:hypothetical protein [Alteribacter keqinensis]RNA67605.1 hypothetical protein EBO34_12840 [Alteribacter keqinensis]
MLKKIWMKSTVAAVTTLLLAVGMITFLLIPPHTQLLESFILLLFVLSAAFIGILLFGLTVSLLSDIVTGKLAGAPRVIASLLIHTLAGYLVTATLGFIVATVVAVVFFICDEVMKLLIRKDIVHF